MERKKDKLLYEDSTHFTSFVVPTWEDVDFEEEYNVAHYLPFEKATGPRVTFIQGKEADNKVYVLLSSFKGPPIYQNIYPQLYDVKIHQDYKKYF